MNYIVNALVSLSDASSDWRYYGEEGCGILAVAIGRLIPGGHIFVLSANNGEAWGDEFPYEITHVVYHTADTFLDFQGARTLEEMAASFKMFGSTFSVKGPWEPEAFLHQFMGSDDEKPLYGDECDIEDAILRLTGQPTYIPSNIRG
ncbi:hypothetical protein ACFOY8_12000 [Thalassospira xianhensis]|uniref:Uncharacterized protein n=1 Tax=Thalassospira xianhensis MCCC 1A02616 TaxID=1177929 RepID=A0A367U810_9PROT|nr:hypothetical protein [Thalassospira xianhensis]RCK04151.1 hypothetical protein TH5_21485 [Thalassospira xianhensis MCCC 1A02616]